MFARTSRLTLRPGWPEDAPALVDAVAHERVAMMLARLPWPYGEAEAAEWLGMARAPAAVALMILAHDGPKVRLVGGVGLEPVSKGIAELGYWLTPAAWGRGYATEAARAVLGIAEHALGLKQVQARYFADNPRSGRVLDRLGFRETGRAPLTCAAQGAERLAIAMSLALSGEERRPALPIAA